MISPGCAALIPPDTDAPPYACFFYLLGYQRFLHCAITYDVNPEQSNPLGEDPPLL